MASETLFGAGSVEHGCFSRRGIAAQEAIYGSVRYPVAETAVPTTCCAASSELHRATSEKLVRRNKWPVTLSSLWCTKPPLPENSENLVATPGISYRLYNHRITKPARKGACFTAPKERHNRRPYHYPQRNIAGVYPRFYEVYNEQIFRAPETKLWRKLQYVMFEVHSLLYLPD
jgi:hypothetical protein